MGQKVREHREKGGIWSPVNLKEWGSGVPSGSIAGGNTDVMDIDAGT